MTTTHPKTTFVHGAEEHTDLTNARRLVSAHGDDLHFCKAWDQWLVWDTRRWAPDMTGEAERRAKHIADSMWADVPLKDGKEVKHWLSHCQRASNAQGQQAMLKLARSEASVAIRPTDLDIDPWLLNVANGTIDLRKGAPRRHFDARRADLMTKTSPVAWDPAAECPTWLAFLHSSLEGNEELISFLQRAVGYSLTGLTTEEILLFLWGPGRNGKSKFLMAIVEVMGGYAWVAPQDLLLMSKGDQHAARIAEFHSRRMVVTSEVEGGRLDVGLLKQLTGGDMLSARRMRENWWTFPPTHSLWMMANHEPIITDATASVWDRVLKIPFAKTIAVEQRDRHLAEKLRREYPGILRWAVEGCLAWQREGLKPPETVTRATAEYRANMDWFQDFLDECCVMQPTIGTYTGALYTAYQRWAIENGLRAKSKKALTQLLKEKGYQYVEQWGARRTGAFVGLGLKGDSVGEPF